MQKREAMEGVGGGGGGRGLMISNLALLSVVYRVTVWQEWQ